MTALGTNVVVDWSPPASNGSPILGYEILFAGSRPANLAFFEVSQYCSGGQSQGVENPIITDTRCTVPMSAFWASPFALSPGDPIELKIRARNAAGSGMFSAIVDSGQIVQTPPQTPT